MIDDDGDDDDIATRVTTCLRVMTDRVFQAFRCQRLGGQTDSIFATRDVVLMRQAFHVTGMMVEQQLWEGCGSFQCHRFGG